MIAELSPTQVSSRYTFDAPRQDGAVAGINNVRGWGIGVAVGVCVGIAVGSGVLVSVGVDVSAGAGVSVGGSGVWVTVGVWVGGSGVWVGGSGVWVGVLLTTGPDGSSGGPILGTTSKITIITTIDPTTATIRVFNTLSDIETPTGE
jgi:hypothetical protein